MIEVDEIWVSHGGEWVLRDVSLAVDEGEYLGLIGPGGAGKSLLLKVVSGLVEPDRGTVHVHGEDVHALGETELAELRFEVGMLFQNYALFDFMTVAENIAFPLRQAGDLPADAIDERVETLLEQIGLPHAAEQYPKELSGGMKKRVSFARAVARKPPILLYDDPTAGLDPVTSSKIFELLEMLKEEHETTAITVSHDVGGIEWLTDRIAMLDRGEVRFEGTVDEIADSDDERVRDFWTSHSLDDLDLGGPTP